MRGKYLFKWSICLIALLAVVTMGYTQTICAFDKANASIKKNYPSIAKNIIDNELKLKNIIAQKRSQPSPEKKQMAIYNIPVVVHVLHTGGDIGTIYNPTDAHIVEAINYLNDVYSGSNSSLTPAGPDAAGDIGIRFVLAQRDPDCNPTNGIDRVDMSENVNYLVYGAIYDDVSADFEMKAPIAWDKSQYYNIYVVNKINGQGGVEAPLVAGYAYLPISSLVDGTVIVASQMRKDSKTLVHEIGHAFNLYHPFEGSAISTECPAGDGDMVDDTDPISYNINGDGTINFMCRTGANRCNNNLPYNIRTENNFMNYTACNTLFTPGQKERMIASLLLEDRKTLITSTAILPTYQNPECPPKINFATAYTELERVPSGITGCRKYKDYTINLNITSNPLTNVSVQLLPEPGSDAVENIDYSFPQGTTITFPAGSHNIQPFKIRVYSGENYTQSRTLKLGFSINRGSNAFKGTACISTTIVILPRDESPVPPGSVVHLQVGEYDEDITDVRVFNGSVQNQKAQILYHADELKKAGIQAGNITGFSFFLLKNTNKAFKNINIKVAHTSYTELVNNGTINIVNNATAVASLASFKTVYGWNNFKFNTPFKWDGTNNVVIEMCINNSTETSFGIDDIYAYADTGNVEKGNTIFSIGEGCEATLSSVSYYPKGIRPVIRFYYIKAGNAVKDTLDVSSNIYLGPFAEVYFYDRSSPGKIIAKIKNLTGWDYGCTNIRIDRFGNSVTPFWNNTKSQYLAQKTFIISPANNNPQGRYEITLYYSDTEKKGYESGTGIAWQNINMIKSDVPINTITPDNPQPDKVEIAPISGFDTYGTAYAVTANFSTGLSAYGIGFTGNTALLVEWGNIQASVVNENAVLKWETITEVNNDHFEVEKSSDGLHFEIIGRVKGRGNSNSNTIAAYEYVDVNVNSAGTGKVYYRIKQVDTDGNQSYSKIVFVTLSNGSTAKPSIYPVPANANIIIDFKKDVLQPVIEIYSSDMKLLGIRKKQGRISTETINVHHLPAGTYFIRLSYEGEKYSLRFVKL
ncbi:MAG: zinc-dependent metalloprotease [Agriterribacter sp.]